MTSRMIVALALALGATPAWAQTPPSAGEGGSGAKSSPAPAVAPATPAAPPAATVPTPPTPAALAPVPPTPAAPVPAAPASAMPASGAPAPATAPGAAPQQGTPATVIDTQDLESLLGRSVRSAQGDELGRVIDVLVDKEGHPRAAIIDFGGFLGVGTRKIAVDWRALRFTIDAKERRLSVALTRNQVRVSPEYKSGEPIVVLGPASGTAPSEADQAAAAAGQAPAAQPGATTPAPQGTVPPVAVPQGSVPAVPQAAAPAAAPVATPPQQAPDK